MSPNVFCVFVCLTGNDILLYMFAVVLPALLMIYSNKKDLCVGTSLNNNVPDGLCTVCCMLISTVCLLRGLSDDLIDTSYRY